ncbi:MAG: GntR family transcriptional regulator [Spirochaetales bacterium]
MKTSYSNEEIYEALKAEILDLTLIPGQFISEIEMTKRFHVSRTPIRDVFKKLEYDKLVQVLPQRGTQILPINLNGISDFMFIRERIETGIIENILEDKLNTIELSRLHMLLKKQEKLFENPSNDSEAIAHEFFLLDNTFHEALFQISNKITLWKTLTVSMSDYQRFRAVHAEFITTENMHRLYEQHIEIYKAIEKKDLDAVLDVYKRHIYNAMGDFSEFVQKKENYFVV